MRRRRLFILCLILSLLALAVTYAWIGNPLDPFDDRRFSPAAWVRAAERHDDEARGRMCRDLIRRHLRGGPTEQEVLALLGPPLPQGWDTGDDPDDGQPAGIKHYDYYVGYWPLHGMDEALLQVRFDPAGRVTDATVYGY